MKRAHGQMSESLLLGAMLAMAGGFFDAYTYLCRGKVFANAQTGNIVLFGANIAEGNWLRAAEYFLPILAFALGVVAAEIVKRRYKKRQTDINIHWRQIVVLVEIVLLIAAAFLPQTLNTTVNIMISFICAMQVESFRKVRGSAFATTMCTGNLRSGTEQLVIWAQTGDRNAIRKTRNYYSIILFFILGGAIGALTTARIGEKALLLTCIPLSLVFTVMFVEEEHTLEAEETAGKER
ncbi:MAG: YoaK family protein [Butyricicoccus sp.]